MKFIKITLLFYAIFTIKFLHASSYEIIFPVAHENMLDSEKNTTIYIEQMYIRQDLSAYEALTYASGKKITREVAIVTDEFIENGTVRRITYENGWVRRIHNAQQNEASVINNNDENHIAPEIPHNGCYTIS
ncbi:MAG: hypothetical protein JO129_03940 [Candidatus Dependentiae bacterium]|nr:hypothetical protein [Candidatus Dependentiae bacterium]